MTSTIPPVIAITMGDPCGIGPEVIAKALADKDLRKLCRPIVIGNATAMTLAVKLAGLSLTLRKFESSDGFSPRSNSIPIIDPGNLDPNEITIGKISSKCGQAAMEWVTQAADLAMKGIVQGLATAPVNKEAASLAGYKAIGHMELLQELSGAKNVATMLMSGKLRVVHLTTHRSLRVACDYVTRDRILSILKLTNDSLLEWGFSKPRIAAAALNPHGSDGGLLGTEEHTEISPAVSDAKALGIDASGPIPADIVFHQAIQGNYDAVLAMYHDQGHIPIKVHGFERSISVNLGLPFVRTSVDHGTAFDIAGKGIADHLSMIEAIRSAATLSTANRLTQC
ncbi:4-hydroxythreonine-4-phosphate dehydrogenase PdxA [SAR202 cluster bacterium AD-804-J14_MRT_500m]|nr:4-hydroxythreonine-4-phosphate dehydrogenase PdxA [SAR202 cluster bacterium AD-804-J14_MRT_500m]